jgi:cell division protease FtsH
VLAIAHALETHKTISGEDVTAIFEGRQGPKINGRDYHHPSFLEVADRYHNEALLAHRSTGRVEVPLPVLIPTVGQLVNANGQLPPPHL